MSIISIAVAMLLTTAACSSEASIDDAKQPESKDSQMPPTGNVATLYTTTADGSRLLIKSLAAVNTGESMAPSTIVIDDSQTFQTMDGFGFAITYSTCYNLLKMSQADRTDFLRQTFSTTDGYGVSYARISIGCSDFSSTEYSLCDEQASAGEDPLAHFRLYSDETQYVIPVLKEILAINPNLKIIAAPWTCPQWMKVSDVDTKAPHYAWTDGHLNPDLRTVYADYFVKFVQAMQQQGIDIYAVSPQNEPLNPGNCASLYMPWQEEAPFVAELAKAFKQNGLSTKIYVFDHNYNYDGQDDQDDYPIKLYNALGNAFEGSELVVGAAYHDYGGNNAELTDIHNKATDKELIFSESSIGEWNDGRNLSTRLVDDMRNVVLATVNQWCRAVLVWNLMLDVNKGPNLDGGCQTCYGAVDIATDYRTITRNSHYFIISHMSSVVMPGAQRLGFAQRSFAASSLVCSAFKNPDGSFAIVVLNAGDTALSANVSSGNGYFRVEFPARSVVSCRWNP